VGGLAGWARWVGSIIDRLLNVANVVAPGDQPEPGDSSFLGWNHGLTAFATINNREELAQAPRAAQPRSPVRRPKSGTKTGPFYSGPRAGGTALRALPDAGMWGSPNQPRWIKACVLIRRVYPTGENGLHRGQRSGGFTPPGARITSKAGQKENGPGGGLRQPTPKVLHRRRLTRGRRSHGRLTSTAPEADALRECARASATRGGTVRVRR